MELLRGLLAAAGAPASAGRIAAPPGGLLEAIFDHGAMRFQVGEVVRVAQIASEKHQHLNGTEAIVVEVNFWEARGCRIKPFGEPEQGGIIAVQSGKLTSLRKPLTGKWMYVRSRSCPEHNGTRVFVQSFDAASVKYQTMSLDQTVMLISPDALVEEKPAKGERCAESAGKRGRDATVETGRCVVCLEATASYIAVKCRHLCFCDGCVGNFQERMPCPVCRQGDGRLGTGAARYGKIYVAMP